MTKDNLIWLQNWFLSKYLKSNQLSIEIDTVDNPGWYVEIRLAGSDLEKKEFNKIKENADSDHNWFFCLVRDSKFEASSAPFLLSYIISIFREWADDNAENMEKQDNEQLLWLQRWYLSQCDEDWEHQYGVVIKTTEVPGWHVMIDLYETELDGREFAEVKDGANSVDSVACAVMDNKFEGFCGPCGLSRVLQIFRSWAESNNEGSV